ncbi:response regulator [Rhodococcus sp. (in: high G+C Gram-positive bacteria)]|uniref:response regulator n=1 Tax=Rhodococcus sp. TaxID=1831 RepID=UPI003B8A77F2
MTRAAKTVDERNTITVLIADDQPVVRQGFELFLASDENIAVVAHAADGAAAVEQAHKHRPDVVLLDIRMPHRHGLWAAQKILAFPEAPKVIVLTTFDHDEYVFTALDIGASGFLLKDIDPPELVSAVKTVARGGAVLSPRIAPRLIAEFARRRPGASTPPARPCHGLSAREVEVVELLTQGLSNEEIAASLQLEQSTVKTHVSNISRKVGVRTRVQVVVWAYRNGVVSTE